VLAGILTLVVLAPAALTPERGSAALLARESMATVLVRPPDHPPLLLRRQVETHAVLGQLPPRPPRLPAVASPRDA
jgi:hypothetical protein